MLRPCTFVMNGRDPFNQNFRMEISVQNSLDSFGPTGKVSKKLVHLLRWSTFSGRTGLNLGWMDRTQLLPSVRDQTLKPHVTSDLWDQFVYSIAILLLLFWHPDYSRQGKKKSHRGCWCVFNLNARWLVTRISHIRDCSLTHLKVAPPTI